MSDNDRPRCFGMISPEHVCDWDGNPTQKIGKIFPPRPLGANPDGVTMNGPAGCKLLGGMNVACILRLDSNRGATQFHE